MIFVISTSLKVVSIAAFSWDCFNLFAIVILSLDILIFSSSPNFNFLSDGAGLTPIKLSKSPLRIIPSLPDPLISSIFILFSFTIFLTAGDITFSFPDLTFSSLFTSSVKTSASSSGS